MSRPLVERRAFLGCPIVLLVDAGDPLAIALTAVASARRNEALTK